MGAKIKIDFTGVQKKVKSKKEKIRYAIAEQVRKDSNYYAPEDNGDLIESSTKASKLEDGIIIWDTPYARRMYWNPQYDFSKDKNPNAQGKWFEKAKSEHLDEWIDIGKEEANK